MAPIIKTKGNDGNQKPKRRFFKIVDIIMSRCKDENGAIVMCSLLSIIKQNNQFPKFFFFRYLRK